MIPQIQPHSHAPQIHAGGSLPQITLSQSGKSTLSSSSSKEGFVMSTLNSIGRFFSWVFSGILYAVTCGCIRKSSGPSLSEIEKKMKHYRDVFDVLGIEVILGRWGVGVRTMEDSNLRTFIADLGAFLGILDTRPLYSNALDGGDLLREVGIHDDLAGYIEFGADAAMLISLMEKRIQDIDDPSLTSLLPRQIELIKQHGLYEELKDFIRNDEKMMCLQQLRKALGN